MGYTIHLRFPENISTKPIVCNLTRKFDLDFNISKAQISSNREGYLILELLCSKEQANQAKKYLEEQGIHVSDLAQSIIRDEKICIECGACTAICPTAALFMNKNRQLAFDADKCVVCTRCIKLCPVNAIKADIGPVNK
ncbi:MAG: 4Fe-4S binding protein [Mailhella sp.]|nr:4Fe-4S binding protein [Mailhella sp.]MDE5681952.1 4Fe-4S binding protein [Mailhella sp.]